MTDCKQQITNLKDLSIHNQMLQEKIHELLDFNMKERRDEVTYHWKKAHFPLQFTLNLRSKSKWQVCWHPKATPLVKFTYQIFHGSINTNNPVYNPKLQEVLQLTKRCLVCQLSNQEWAHPLEIIIAGNQGGHCSTKVANTLVPQWIPMSST